MQYLVKLLISGLKALRKRISKKMTLTTFNEIIEEILEHEGGYVNDPLDAGGETNFGIAKRFYPNVDIKNLTKEQAKKIYHQDYWRPAKCDAVPSHLRYIYFDMCVNFGRSGAVKVLQRAANAKNRDKIEVDGGIGPATLKAIQNLEILICKKQYLAVFKQGVTKQF